MRKFNDLLDDWWCKLPGCWMYELYTEKEYFMVHYFAIELFSKRLKIDVWSRKS